MFAEKNILTKARTDPGGALRARSESVLQPAPVPRHADGLFNGLPGHGQPPVPLCLTGWQFGRRANCNSKRRRPGICQVALSGAVGP